MKSKNNAAGLGRACNEKISALISDVGLPLATINELRHLEQQLNALAEINNEDQVGHLLDVFLNFIRNDPRDVEEHMRLIKDVWNAANEAPYIPLPGDNNNNNNNDNYNYNDNDDISEVSTELYDNNGVDYDIENTDTAPEEYDVDKYSTAETQEDTQAFYLTRIIYDNPNIEDSFHKNSLNLDKQKLFNPVLFNFESEEKILLVVPEEIISFNIEQIIIAIGAIYDYCASVLD